MIIVFLGPPGSGKGTQAKLLHQKIGGFYFEGGDILREKAKENSPLGRKIKEIIYQKGSLVPNGVMSEILEDWLENKDIEKGVIFDGFPRSLSQYHTLENLLAKRGEKITKVIFLAVRQKTVIARLSARRVCPKCDFEYNLITRPPKKDEVCDFCGTKLVQRADDTPNVIQARLKTYFEMTQPVINAARKQGILEEVDGEKKIEEIHREILERLGK
ncbi:MAG: adenylate kinase family protein [Microgenomates group bacterium]